MRDEIDKNSSGPALNAAEMREFLSKKEEDRVAQLYDLAEEHAKKYEKSKQEPNRKTYTFKSKHQHGEAFCLMWYMCENCGHKERIWNSRDGITSFTLLCPSCSPSANGKNNYLKYIDFMKDEYVPNHKLTNYQKYWRDGTKEDALRILETRMNSGIIKELMRIYDLNPEEYRAHVMKAIEDETGEFNKGWPYLDVKIP